MPFLSIIERSNSFCLFNDYFNRATNIATKFFPMLLSFEAGENGKIINRNNFL